MIKSGLPASHPGEFLAETLDELGVSQAQFARAIGELRSSKHKLVVAWIEIHREDLLANWSLAVNGQKPFPIKGLDQ